MLTHHPSEDMLLDYAAGAMAEPLAILMAAHLSLCPACRDSHRRLEALGGALLDGLPEAPVADDALSRALDRVRSRAPEPEPPPRPDDATRAVLPAPLWPYVGHGLAGRRWRWRGPAMRETLLPTTVPGWRVSLFTVRPGKAVPAHRHAGTEYTLVLAGGLTDRSNGDHIVRGDVDVASGDHVHRQRADAGEECLCLAVLDAPVRLEGPLGWVANPFLRF